MLNAARSMFALACLLCAAPLAGFAQTPSPRPSPLPSFTAPPPTGAPTSPPSGAPVGKGTIVLPVVLASALPSMGQSAPPQQYATFVRSAERQSGLIDILHKDDDVYFDLGPEQLDRPFIVAPVLASGVGSDAFAGRIYSTFVIEFHRIGRRILWIDKNSYFSAPPNSTAANALAISVTDSVINSSPIVAEDEKAQRIVVSAGFFLTDFENVGKDLGGGGGEGPILVLGGSARPSFTVDASRSYIERTKALPKNDEILSNLAFAGPPGDDVSGAPDARGVRLRMHYSIVDPPDATKYVPRFADDRVGYFISAQKRFDNDSLPTPFVRYINRWNFAQGPIVYYLTNEIPAEYKAPIRKALLEWNVAFAKVGIPNAIEVRDQPDDPNWDPDDVRYSTVRWITSDHPGFVAYGPHIADPGTGQIFRVEIVIDGEEMRDVKRGFTDIVAPTHPAAFAASGFPIESANVASACGESEACDTFGQDAASMAAEGAFALRAAGATPATLDAYAQDFLQMVVLHESGHNFGLRHNFISSTLYSLAQIHNPQFTREHGIVGSVMGYTPVNLSPPGQSQGEYFQLKLGPYDEWAIRYGYERFPNVTRPEDEIVPLRGIADESSRREYAYATDEDASGPLAIDPRVARFALSSDPLGYDKSQFDVADNLVAKLDATFARSDQPYYEERESFLTIMRQYDRAALLTTKWIGGIYASRDHRGQPGGAHPFTPVPRERSREAFALLANNVFSSHALRFSPQLLQDLGPNYYLHRGVDSVDQPDFPVEEFVADLQDAVMFSLYSPETMSRLADGELKNPPGVHTMSLGDLFGWMQGAVWDDLRPGMTSIDPLHRALQRRQTRLLIAFSLAPSFIVDSIGYPSDSPGLARFELHRLSDRIAQALRSSRLDVETRAHLEDVQSRVDRALAPTATRGA
jgi:Met-zincin/Domain of unknown function (DUF5117)